MDRERMLRCFKNITFLQVEPTTYCNFTCDFCCGRHLKQANLDLNIYQKCIEKLPALKYLELQGEGEPFLCPDFFDMVRIARERNIEISTITNGSLLTKENVEKILDSGLHYLSVSLETTDQKKFEEIRGGNLNQILSGIKYLVEAKRKEGIDIPHISFSVTILKENIDEVDKIFSLYEKLNLDGGIILQFLNESRDYVKYYNKSLKGEQISVKDREKIYHKYYKFLAKQKLLDQQEGHFFTLLHNGRKSMEKGLQCNWLNSGLYLKVDGSIAPCVYSKEKSFGNAEKEWENIIEQRCSMINDFERKCIPALCKEIHCGVVSL